MNWYFEALKKYVVFNGRARRKEYWYFLLINLIITFIIGFINSILLASGSTLDIEWLNIIYSVAVILPSIAVAIRRLHDTDRTGWWLLISLIPLVGTIILLIFLVSKSSSGENKYGPSPLIDSQLT